MAVGPKDDMKSLERSHYGRPLPAMTLSPPLEKVGEAHRVLDSGHGRGKLVLTVGKK